MTDVVQNEAEAIAIINKLLDDGENWRKRKVDERMRKMGKDWEYEKQGHKLEKITEHPQGWTLTYAVVASEGVLVEPSTKVISINKKTGETKAGYFGDE